MQHSAANLDDVGLAPTPVTEAPITDVPADGRGLTRRVFGLAWPVLALNSLVLLVELPDPYPVGNLPGIDADDSRHMLASGATARDVAGFISSYAVLISVGATGLVARCVGAGD